MSDRPEDQGYDEGSDRGEAEAEDEAADERAGDASDEAGDEAGDDGAEPGRDRPPSPRRWRARVPQGSQLVVTVVSLAIVLVAVVLLVGPVVWEKLKPDDDIDAAPAFVDYCREVQAQQSTLSQIDDGSPAGLLQALPSLEALQAEAPDDIADDWDTVVARTRALVDALDAAGVDEGDYDDYAQVRRDLDPDDRRAIGAAVKRLVEPGTVSAFEAVQQQARDVCKTPLTTS